MDREYDVQGKLEFLDITESNNFQRAGTTVTSTYTYSSVEVIAAKPRYRKIY